MIFSKDSTARSWVEQADGSDFPIQNLPFGVFSLPGEDRRIGVAIGDRILDLAAVQAAGLFDDTPVAVSNVFAAAALNDYFACGTGTWSAVRTRLVALLATDDVVSADGRTIKVDGRLRDDSTLCSRALVDQSAVQMHLPARIGNFVDFYSSKEHATNVGSMFRPDNPLLPNWVHIPIGYNGRASSVVISGTPIRRPCGQTKADDADRPTYGPCRLLDIELEMGFFIGPDTELGTVVRADRVTEHIFGMVVVNDWSARDIQKWEYQPLGPFLGKSFGTSISPWVVPLDALQPFRTAGPPMDPPPLPYLVTDGDWALDIDLEVYLQGKAMSAPHRLASTNFKYMYWSVVQQLLHLASNGTNISAGDLYASGTVSGPTPDSYGSMLELAWRGTKPIPLPDGTERKFLLDGDTVIMRGYCTAPHFRIGFGDCAGTIVPAEQR